MIPKIKEKPVKLSTQTLGKKKINFTTLQTILERSGANQELRKKILSKIEDYI
jgi:hypothetical protein